MLDDALSTWNARQSRGLPLARRGDQTLQRLLDALPVAAYACDGDGLLTACNRHAERIWGRTPRLGDPAERFCGSYKLLTSDGEPISPEECWMALALRLGREFVGHELIVERPDGGRSTVLVHASPLRDVGGAVIGALNLLVDISDRKVVETAEREANRAKSEFLATMSHEIRTPINAIIGYADLLELEVAGPLTPAQQSQLTRIRAASRHLISLVNEVLDLSKLEAGRMVLRCEPHRVRDAVTSALDVVQPLAASKGVVLGGQHRGDWSAGYLGDEDRVRQMLINLLSNAVKYSGAGAHVDVVCEVREHADEPIASETKGGGAGWVCLRVCDTGEGIPPEELGRIFEPFVQVGGALTHSSGGTGLGLSISRRLARLMGGDLTARSAVGRGSVFSLWLPAAPPDDADADSGPAEAGIDSHVFGAVAHALMARIDEILVAYLERLRTGDFGPRTHTLSDAQLGDHAATLVADIAVTLLALDEGRLSYTFRASAEIQHACAAAHGRQRAELGWTEADIQRDFESLWLEIAPRVRAVTAGRETDRQNLLAVIRGRLEQARGYSVEGLRRGLEP